MKKLVIVLICIILLFGTSLGIVYIIKNNQTKNEWNERFNRCKASIDHQREHIEESISFYHEDEDKVTYLQNQLTEFNDCVNKGGCYTCQPCNSRPKLVFRKFLLDFFIKEGSCTADCVYFCMYHSDYY
ncbi:hypothetical protein JXB41_00685 [Candidatus Woesearchaeota archaeon]|nr:hypothetical protein [Candidatus Woesearchaeota archaeon]